MPTDTCRSLPPNHHHLGTRKPPLTHIMGTIMPEDRVDDWNVRFLDRHGVVFAGLHQNPTKPSITYHQAIQLLVGAFDLWWKPITNFLGDVTWSLRPQYHQGVLDETWRVCDGFVSSETCMKKGLLGSTTGPMGCMWPIQPGGYYLLKQDSFHVEMSRRNPEKWAESTVYGAVPRPFTAFYAALQPFSAIKNLDNCGVKGLPMALSNLNGKEPLTNVIVPDFVLIHLSIFMKDHSIQALRGPANQMSMRSGHQKNRFAAGLLAVDPATFTILALAEDPSPNCRHGRVMASPPSTSAQRALLRIHYLQSLHTSLTARAMWKPVFKLDPWHTNQMSLLIDNTYSTGTPRRQSQVAQAFCTQQCLLGLKDGKPMDLKCPNKWSHLAYDHISVLEPGSPRKHLIDMTKFVKLVQELLRREEGRKQYVEQPRPSTQGHHGQFFKITEVVYGYTFVAKGMVDSDQHKMSHELRIYSEMKRLQGWCVPVCLGAFALQEPCGYFCGIAEAPITHMMLLSNAGIPLETERKRNDVGLSVEDLESRSELTFQHINSAGVDRDDYRLKHQFWNEERRRVFIIDFEKDDLCCS